MPDAGCPAFFGLRLEFGTVSTFLLVLYTRINRLHRRKYHVTCGILVRSTPIAVDPSKAYIVRNGPPSGPLIVPIR